MDMKEKLVEIFCSVLGVEPDFSNAEAMEFVEELIAHGVTVQKWISVKDRLPEAHRLVLCRWTRGIGASYGFARYNHDNDVWYVSNEGMPEVTHWMPMPQPPKGE